MKIAACLSGQPRTRRHTHASLIAFFAPHDVEIFFHTWDEANEGELAELGSTYGPRAFRIERRPLFFEERQRLAERCPDLPPFSAFDMFHSVAASLQLALDADAAVLGFDLVCRARFDTVFDGRLTDIEAPSGTIVVQSGNYDPDGGCNDQFAIARPDATRLYAAGSALSAAPRLEEAFAFAPPLEQPISMGWRAACAPFARSWRRAWRRGWGRSVR